MFSNLNHRTDTPNKLLSLSDHRPTPHFPIYITLSESPRVWFRGHITRNLGAFSTSNFVRKSRNTWARVGLEKLPSPQFLAQEDVKLDTLDVPSM